MEKGVFLIFPMKDIQLAALLQNFKGPKIFINFQFHQFYRERQSFPWPLVLYTTKCSAEMSAFRDQGRVDSGLRMSQARKVAQFNRTVCQCPVPPYRGLANVTTM